MQSQRWMFTSPGGEDEYKRPSVTREHYDAVIKAKDELTLTETEQKRLEFECLLWKKMTEKVLDQFEKRQQFINEIPKICSTYKDSYDKGFKVRELGTKIGEELELKYPLYTDTAKSHFLKEIHKFKAKDPVHKSHATIFRRDNRFTSRLSNPLDVHIPVGVGHFAYV